MIISLTVTKLHFIGVAKGEDPGGPEPPNSNASHDKSVAKETNLPSVALVVLIPT